MLQIYLSNKADELFINLQKNLPQEIHEVSKIQKLFQQLQIEVHEVKMILYDFFS